MKQIRRTLKIVTQSLKVGKREGIMGEDTHIIDTPDMLISELIN